MTQGAGLLNLADERGVLRASILATLLISALGIGFGLAAGSFSIVFDGVYLLVDASMSMLALVVVNLIMSHAVSKDLPDRMRQRFSMGFWHLEPMVLLLNGTLLIGVAVYALVNAIDSLLNGGRDLQFGWAIIYAVATVTVCAAIAFLEARANRKIGSDFVRLDVKGWIMSTCITAALLVAFSIGYAVQGTPWQWVSPYIDPAVLAVVCVLIIPLPVATLRRALGDVLLLAPDDLRQHVDAVASAFVERHGFRSYRAYAARVGRSKIIELYFIVPVTMPTKAIGEWDALRDEVGTAIGAADPHRWLTVVFTADLAWAD
ncbi:cation diffusion facilitator family transporter [Reyranella sp. CPCC 100927]|uniref:cation diffusion facilitator family transporter n=1 Tax=Reyranella sp. CPCC 100927 TaxID=2599616 RepID=UPI0011B49021|nr:cation transporter [Reyranella sp. CPCC 100927]TWS99832.1 cation transporter [Reyranella sp. CPCC 100927]